MQRRRTTEIVLLTLGLLLACCWLPRGILGLLTLTRVVGAASWMPNRIWQLLHMWADPLTWYGQQVYRSLPRVGPRVHALLVAVPNCLCGMMAIAIAVLVVFLLVGRQRVGSKDSERRRDV